MIECADRDGRLLLAKNAAWKGNMFALITGFMEAGETPQAGIAREVAEETALQVDALQLIDISNNIGDSRSLMTHPASTTHAGVSPENRAAMGIADGMLRLNVGLEDPQDLIEDLDRALTAVGL